MSPLSKFIMAAGLVRGAAERCRAALRSLGRLLPSRACPGFTGRFEFSRSIAPVESKHEHDILFALTCLLKPPFWIFHPQILLEGPILKKASPLSFQTKKNQPHLRTVFVDIVFRWFSDQLPPATTCTRQNKRAAQNKQRRRLRNG